MDSGQEPWRPLPVYYCIAKTDTCLPVAISPTKGDGYWQQLILYLSLNISLFKIFSSLFHPIHIRIKLFITLVVVFVICNFVLLIVYSVSACPLQKLFPWIPSTSSSKLSLSWLQSCCVWLFLQYVHLCPGPHAVPFFLQPHLLESYPDLHPHPFYNNRSTQWLHILFTVSVYP